MNIAIIGSNGFIGCHLVNHLSENPAYNLFLFGRNEINFNTSVKSYNQIDSLTDIEFNTLFKDIDLVYYLASASIPSSTWNNPRLELELNLFPFIDFLERCSKLKLKKVAFLSSAGTIYGPSINKMKENAEKHPHTPHGIIKLTMEHFLDYYKSRSEIQFDIFRVSNVFGEGQNTSKGLGLINTFIESIYKINAVNVYGDGMNLRNYIYVRDVVRLLELSAKKDLNSSGIYNICSNDSYTVLQVIELLKESIDTTFSVNHLEKRGSDNLYIDIDNSEILKHFPGYKFENFKTALNHTASHIKKNYLGTGN
jgi:UDP-glucose 4-epimerase